MNKFGSNGRLQRAAAATVFDDQIRSLELYLELRLLCEAKQPLFSLVLGY